MPRRRLDAPLEGEIVTPCATCGGFVEDHPRGRCPAARAPAGPRDRVRSKESSALAVVEALLASYPHRDPRVLAERIAGDVPTVRDLVARLRTLTPDQRAAALDLVPARHRRIVELALGLLGL